MDVNTIRNSVSINNTKSASEDVITNDNVKTSEIKQTESKQIEQHQDEIDKKELDKAVTQLNKFLEADKTHAEYSVHKDLGTIMIKIVRDDTKETVLEAPPQKILDMIASLLREDGLLDKKA